MAASPSYSMLKCRFSQRGFCREGTACPFSHTAITPSPSEHGDVYGVDLPTSRPQGPPYEIPEFVCLYNLRTGCQYGSECRFIHMSPEEIVLYGERQASLAYDDGLVDESYEVGYEGATDDTPEVVSTTTEERPIDPSPSTSSANHAASHSSLAFQPSSSSFSPSSRNRSNNRVFSKHIPFSGAYGQQRESGPVETSKKSAADSRDEDLVSGCDDQLASSPSHSSASSSNSSPSPSSLSRTPNYQDDEELVGMGRTQSPIATSCDIAPARGVRFLSAISSGDSGETRIEQARNAVNRALASSSSSADHRADGQSSSETVTPPHPPTLSYARVASGTTRNANLSDEYIEKNKSVPLCPYGMEGECEAAKFDQCGYLHGDPCDLCGRLILHPFNEEQRNGHREECIRDHEQEMELSFAIQRSKDKQCGICMDTIFDKEKQSDRRFGILEKCTHIFCLECIRKWRQTKQFDNRTIRACPECRVNSDFVVPSKYWVDTKEDKDRLIDDYKNALSNKPCKYFKQGRGECPFAGACFYLHQYPDGRKAAMPPPRPRRRHNQDGDVEHLRDMLLWNYLERRDDRSWLLTLDLEDIFDNDMSLFSDTDEEDDELDVLEEEDGHSSASSRRNPFSRPRTAGGGGGGGDGGWSGFSPAEMW